MEQTVQSTSKSGSNGIGNGMNHHADSAEAREKLMADLKQSIQDAEQWLRSASLAGAADLGQVKAKFEDSLRTAKIDLLKLEDSVIARTKIAAQATDNYVHDNPWKSVTVGAAVGVLLGVLIARR